MYFYHFLLLKNIKNNNFSLSVVAAIEKHILKGHTKIEVIRLSMTSDLMSTKLIKSSFIRNPDSICPHSNALKLNIFNLKVAQSIQIWLNRS